MQILLTLLFGIISSKENNIVKHPKERENGEAQTIGIGLRRKRRKDNDYNNDSDSTIIDPANQNDIDDVVSSGGTLTDYA